MRRFALRQAQRLSWLLFGILFIVWMLNSGKIYHACAGKSHAVKLCSGLEPRAQGNLDWEFLKIRTTMDKFKENVVLNGKLPAMVNPLGLAQVRLFFRSPETLHGVIAKRDSFRGNSRDFAINWFVSTSDLEDSIYQIGLYVLDDDGERFAWTNLFFKKIAGGPWPYFAGPEVLIPSRVDRDLRFVLEKVDHENGEFLLQGWVVLDHAEMNDYNAYIVLQAPKAGSKAFYAPLFTRMDIASMFEDSRAANCGFRVRIRERDLAAGRYRIKIMIKSRKTGEIIEPVQAETRRL